MAFIKVSSSQVHSLSHDPVEETLHVRFLCTKCRDKVAEDCPSCKGNGFSSTYRYDGVPSAVYAAIRDSESVGAALNKHLKKGDPLPDGRHHKPGGYKFDKV